MKTDERFIVAEIEYLKFIELCESHDLNWVQHASIGAFMIAKRLMQEKHYTRKQYRNAESFAFDYLATKNGVQK